MYISLVLRSVLIRLIKVLSVVSSVAGHCITVNRISSGACELHALRPNMLFFPRFVID